MYTSRRYTRIIRGEINNMCKVFEIYLYICGGLVSLAILLGLIILILNVIAYTYETYIGFKTFNKFLKKYHREMKEEKRRIK